MGVWRRRWRVIAFAAIALLAAGTGVAGSFRAASVADRYAGVRARSDSLSQIDRAVLVVARQLRELEAAGRVDVETHDRLQLPLTWTLRELEGAPIDVAAVRTHLEMFLQQTRGAVAGSRLMAADAGGLVTPLIAGWSGLVFTQGEAELEGDDDLLLMNSFFHAAIDRGGRHHGRKHKELLQQHPEWEIERVARLEAGRVERGDTHDMVRFALGDPDAVADSTAGAQVWSFDPDVGDPFWFPPHTGRTVRFEAGTVAEVLE